MCLLDERHSSPEPQSFYGLEPGHEKYILSSLPVPICESLQEIYRSIPLKKCPSGFGTDPLKDPDPESSAMNDYKHLRRDMQGRRTGGLAQYVIKLELFEEDDEVQCPWIKEEEGQ